MLYLAEVHKKTGFMGVKTELKLLARQQSEQNWSTLPGEEMIPIEVANDYNAGVLVLVEMDGNQQVKKVQDANRHLVGILKNFSRMREKFRTQEEEIEGWKQSLIYQSQELTRREVDIEVRSEELQQLETESHKLVEQRQEFDATRAQILQLKEEIETDRRQLEEAWGKLHNAQQQYVQDRKGGLSDEQLQQLEVLIGQLEGSLANGENVRRPLQTLRLLQDEQQATLQPFWDQMDQSRGSAEAEQLDLEQQSQELAKAWQEWHQNQDALNQLCIQAQVQQETLQQRQTLHQWLATQIQSQVAIEQGLQRLRNGISGDPKLDLEALQSMPIEELESTVQRLQQELSKFYHFVADQEEELKARQEEMEQFQARINSASEYERLNLASDLEYEQQNYKLLENTLQGQRETLGDRDAVLKAHQDILSRRKGHGSDSALEQKVNPLLEEVAVQRQGLEQSLQSLEQEISHLQHQLQQTQEKVDSSTASLANIRNSLAERSQALDERRKEVGHLFGKIDTIQLILQPIQDKLTQSKETLENVWSPLDAVTSEQQEVTGSLKQTLLTLAQVEVPV